ncbi:MAG: alpha-hydroxy-acid oxidizing protein [Hyphomicrobiales bacterium]|nr:alpha-hydroxy-acid oxidizing protein [Hyphomicrobiales bacterium]
MRDKAVSEGNRFEVLHEFATAAREALTPRIWDYVMGGSETETTLRRNRMALDALAFRPRVLRDVATVETGAKVLGHDLRLPVILAPIGSLQDLVPEGGVVPTRAAARYGVLHMLSLVSEPGLEETAAAADHPKIFQIYVRGGADWVDDLVKRAIDNGYAAICFTVDLDYYGRRERDLAKRFKTTARQASNGEEHQSRFSWADIERVRGNIDVPLILKGIARADDAVLAVEHGVDMVYVSNHGGRQLDHGLGAIEMLPEIVDAVAGRAEIVVDGAIMRGADIVKAIALGANAVGIGRLQGLAAAAAGEDGVVRMLELLEDEVRRTLGMLGVTSYAELDASYLTSATPLDRSPLSSAFPLLEEGY